MDDVSKRAKLLGNSELALYSCLFISTLNFPKKKATTEKVPSGSLLSRAGHFWAHPGVGLCPVRVTQFSAQSLGHSRQALGLTSRVFGRQQPRSSPRDLERPGDYQAEKGGDFPKKNQPGTSLVVGG